MGRPLGAKNKRTLLREANIKEAAARAQFDLTMTDDEPIKADSLAVMEDAMTYFYRLALKEKRRNGDADPKTIRDNWREAVTIAKEVAPYRHARLSSVKVGSDRTNIPDVPEGVTSQEIRAELFSEIARRGLLPTHLTKLLPNSGRVLEPQFVVDRDVPEQFCRVAAGLGVHPVAQVGRELLGLGLDRRQRGVSSRPAVRR